MTNGDFNKAENFSDPKMNIDEGLFSGMMQTSVTSESSTLSGLATGPIPGVAMNSGAPPGGLAFDTDASYAVMNDKVQALAGSIYEELERMITKYDQVKKVLEHSIYVQSPICSAKLSPYSLLLQICCFCHS